MLEKKYRLTKKEDFDNVFKGGSWARGKLLSLRIKKTTNSLPPRIGFVVGTRITKKAVIRNKIKRRLRASFSRHVGEIRRGLDIVVVPTPDIINKKFTDIHEEITHLLTKAHLIND